MAAYLAAVSAIGSGPAVRSRRNPPSSNTSCSAFVNPLAAGSYAVGTMLSRTACNASFNVSGVSSKPRLAMNPIFDRSVIEQASVIRDETLLVWRGSRHLQAVLRRRGLGVRHAHAAQDIENVQTRRVARPGLLGDRRKRRCSTQQVVSDHDARLPIGKRPAARGRPLAGRQNDAFQARGASTDAEASAAGVAFGNHRLPAYARSPSRVRDSQHWRIGDVFEGTVYARLRIQRQVSVLGARQDRISRVRPLPAAHRSAVELPSMVRRRLRGAPVDHVLVKGRRCRRLRTAHRAPQHGSARTDACGTSGGTPSTAIESPPNPRHLCQGLAAGAYVGARPPGGAAGVSRARTANARDDR